MILETDKRLLFAVSEIENGNMSVARGNSDEALVNRQNFFKPIGLEGKIVIQAELENGLEIARVNKNFPDNGIVKADGLITNQPELKLFIVVADCNAIALFDPVNQAIGLIHAGRLNLEGKILNKAVEQMSKEFGSLPENLTAYFSPAIGPCCYKPFVYQSGKEILKYIKADSLDIWTWAEEQLQSAGVWAKNIHNPRICTYHSNNYFSHKKFLNEKLEKDYRFAVVAGIKK